MSNSPFANVGKLNGNPRPEILSCGHVQLISGSGPGARASTVEFETAYKYAAALQKMLDEALEKAMIPETAYQVSPTPPASGEASSPERPDDRKLEFHIAIMEKRLTIQRLEAERMEIALERLRTLRNSPNAA